MASDLTPSEAARARLGARARGGHGRGLGDLPHLDPRPLPGHPRRGRAQGRHAGGEAGGHGGGGRHAGRAWWSSRRRPPSPASATVQQEYRQEEEHLQGTRALPAVTLDGVAVVLQANVEFPDEASTATVVRRAGDRPLPVRVPAGPWPQVAERGAAGGGLPAPARADAPAPGDGADLGRGAGGVRPRRTLEPEPRARGARAPAPAARPGRVPRAAARAPPGRQARSAAHPLSLRCGVRGPAPRPRPRRAGTRRSCAARASRSGRTCPWA